MIRQTVLVFIVPLSPHPGGVPVLSLGKTLLSTRMAREQDEVSWRHFYCEIPPQNLTLLYSQLLVNIQLLDKATKLRQQKPTIFISLIT
jgi:hypothetical protein